MADFMKVDLLTTEPQGQASVLETLYLHSQYIMVKRTGRHCITVRRHQMVQTLHTMINSSPSLLYNPDNPPRHPIAKSGLFPCDFPPCYGFNFVLTLMNRPGRTINESAYGGSGSISDRAPILNINVSSWTVQCIEKSLNSWKSARQDQRGW